MGWFLVVDNGKDGLEPSGEACVHPRLPKIMRTDFEKNISKDFKKNAQPKLGVAEDGGGWRLEVLQWSMECCNFWTGIKRLKC
jgi:hypothetical protein